MSIASYPRTIQNGQIASNGNANAGTGLMLWDSATNTYIAATPSTFGGAGSGGATAANQTSQITSQNAQTNGGILIDKFYTQNLTTSYNSIPYILCKYVTLINLSTNNPFTYQVYGSSANLTLEAGYSVRINVTQSSYVAIAQTTGEGQVCQIIVTT